MKLLCIFVLLLASSMGVWAADSAIDAGEIARQIREIFRAKCVDCHGPELARPKGKFGYVLDLQRVAENPDYVTRGQPEKSELYLMVRDEEMPGEDADVPPLTAGEKEAVRRWIELGAPDASGASTIAPKAAAAPAKASWPFWKRALEWAGRFHPVSTHFPIALMFAAVFAEGLAWWTKRPSWLQTVRFLVVLAALGALATGSLGWINAAFSSYSREPGALLWWHRWLGTGAALWAVVCAMLIVLHACEEGSRQRQRFRGALLFGAVLVGLSGFLGGALIYGLDHYAWK